MRGQDYIDVIGATSVAELADVIIVTPTADRDLHVSIEFGPIDDTARKAPDMWTRRITITHHRSAEDRRRWTHHLYHSLADRCDWEHRALGLLPQQRQDLRERGRGRIRRRLQRVRRGRGGLPLLPGPPGADPVGVRRVLG